MTRLKGILKCQRRPKVQQILLATIVFLFILYVSKLFDETSHSNNKSLREDVIRKSLQDIYRSSSANKSNFNDLSKDKNIKNISEADTLQLQSLMDAMRGKKPKTKHVDAVSDNKKPLDAFKMIDQLREVLNQNKVPIEGAVKSLLNEIYKTLTEETVYKRADMFNIQLGKLSKLIREQVVKRKLHPIVEGNEIKYKTNKSIDVNRTGRNIMSLNMDLSNKTSNFETPEIIYNKMTTTEHKMLQGIYSNSSLEDDFPFQYLINEPTFCSHRDNLYIINMVGVAPWEFIVRSSIRSLWGSDKWRNKTGFSTVFLIGSTKDANLVQKIKEESDIYHDIIQFDFFDSYKNLTLKTLSGLHWVKKFCPNPKWVLKSDTDVLVNTFQLSRFLINYDKTFGEKRNQLICKRKPTNNLTPCRDCSKRKWRVSKEEWPLPRYPPHCQGPGYLIPRRLVGAIYNASDKFHPFRMEDIYYTGVVPSKLNLNITRWNIKNRFPWRPRSWYKMFTNSALMILELDKGVGRGSSSYTWTKILEYEDKRQQRADTENLNKELFTEISTESTDDSS